MLNLSDNELDRLSREAASQHDPGDLMGPRSWDRLEVRLDKELGRAGPDISRGMRGFRRLPFQYAPVILLIVGVSYYFVKTKVRKAEPSGSPPLTVVKNPEQQPGTTSDSSLKNPVYSDKSTSTLYPDQSQSKDAVAGASNAAAAAADKTSSGASGSAATTVNGRNVLPSGKTGRTGGSGHSGHTRLSGDIGIPGRSGLSGSTASSYGSGLSGNTGLSGNSGRSGNTGLSGHNGHSGHTGPSGHTRLPGQTDPSEQTEETGPSGQTGQKGLSGQSGKNMTPAVPEPSGPYRSLVQKPRNLRSRPTISDSALRAYTAQTPTNPGKKSGPSVHVNRSLTFGVQIAPDFTSVNALAGDRPGSSLGLTVDYQFLNGWHLGTGVLFSRKNYTARATDYHVPYDYYMRNSMKGVDFVKGTMNFLEIPINLRYDFSVTGNTIFFASGGVSTYLFGQEHCNYYFDFFGREVRRDFRYSNQHNGLFSSANLSLGVETGISNSVSVQVAPYMNLPISDIGFGKIRMNSVGINFAVRYAPVISRKRKH